MCSVMHCDVRGAPDTHSHTHTDAHARTHARTRSDKRRLHTGALSFYLSVSERTSHSFPPHTSAMAHCDETITKRCSFMWWTRWGKLRKNEAMLENANAGK